MQSFSEASSKLQNKNGSNFWGEVFWLNEIQHPRAYHDLDIITILIINRKTGFETYFIAIT